MVPIKLEFLEMPYVHIFFNKPKTSYSTGSDRKNVIVKSRNLSLPICAFRIPLRGGPHS